MQDLEPFTCMLHVQHVLVMFFACFNEFCSHIGIKDRVLGEVTPSYIGDKEATVEHGYNEFLYNEFMVIMNLSLHPVVISVFHCSSFTTKLWL